MKGHFGKYGGRYVPEMLIPALEELETAYEKAKKDKTFQKEFTDLLKKFSGRPTPLTFAKNLTEKLGGAKIYLKMKDSIIQERIKLLIVSGKHSLQKSLTKQD